MPNGDFIVTRPGWFDPPTSPKDELDASQDGLNPLAEERIFRDAIPTASDVAAVEAGPVIPSLAQEGVVEHRTARASAEPRAGRRWSRLLLKTAGAGVAAGIALAALGVAAYRFVDPPYTPTMAIRASGGADIRREVVPLDRISPHLIRAVIAAEDARFCQHGGFDQEEISRAMAAARRGEGLRGASTISQQTAKNAFLWTGGGWARKGAEAGLTGLIELTWPKRRIMEVYLNEAEWGDGLFGAQAAAQGRFGKNAADLTRREAALLAAVLPSPNRYRLDPPTDTIASRAATIEARMSIVARDGLASCLLTGSEPVALEPAPVVPEESAPVFVDPRPQRRDLPPLPPDMPPLQELPPLADEPPPMFQAEPSPLTTP